MKLQGPNFFLFKDTLKNYHFRLLVFMCYIHLHICEYVLHDVNWSESPYRSIPNSCASSSVTSPYCHMFRCFLFASSWAER